LAFATALLLWNRRRMPGALAVWTAYLVLLAPASGLVRTGPMWVADRTSYLPTIGFYVLAAGALAWARPLSRPRLLGTVLVAIAVAAMVIETGLTWRQCQTWSSSATVWAHAASRFSRDVRARPGSADAHHNLGVALSRGGRLEEAMDEFERALRLDPTRAVTRGSLGQLLAERGQLGDAEAELAEAVRLDPRSPDLHGGLALIRLNLGRLPEARAGYAEALRLEPGSADWHAGLGVVLYREGRLPEAEAELAEAVRLEPDDPLMRDHLTRVRRARGAR
jgi:Flp pilus assembly protein TadD